MSRGLIILLAACTVATLVGGCGSSSNDTATCASMLRTLAPVTNRGAQRATGSTIDVDGANAGFTPTCITDVPRGLVTLTMHNTGRVIHDIGVETQHVEREVAPGKSVTIRVRVGAEPVVFVCRIHRSLGMIGVLLPAS